MGHRAVGGGRGQATTAMSMTMTEDVHKTHTHRTCQRPLPLPVYMKQKTNKHHQKPVKVLQKLCSLVRWQTVCVILIQFLIMSKEAKHFNAKQNQRITRDPTDGKRVRKRHTAVFMGFFIQFVKKLTLKKSPKRTHGYRHLLPNSLYCCHKQGWHVWQKY